MLYILYGLDKKRTCTKSAHTSECTGNPYLYRTWTVAVRIHVNSCLLEPVYRFLDSQSLFSRMNVNKLQLFLHCFMHWWIPSMHRVANST